MGDQQRQEQRDCPGPQVRLPYIAAEFGDEPLQSGSRRGATSSASRSSSRWAARLGRAHFTASCSGARRPIGPGTASENRCRFGLRAAEADCSLSIKAGAADCRISRVVARRLDRIAISARLRTPRLTHARSARSRIVTWPTATAPAPSVAGTPDRSAASTPWTLAVWIVLTIHDDELDAIPGASATG
jgi:hypothetical protein